MAELSGLKLEQRHGKSRVRVARVWRDRDGKHHFAEWSVNISLLSDCLPAYISGDNSDIVATDTMKNTVYAKAKECSEQLSAEDFAIVLAKHFTSFYQQVTAAVVNIVEKPWERVSIKGQQHEHGGEKKNVVVIGGGVAGSVVAKTLQNEVNVSLIDEKEYYEITWASLRCMVEPEFAKRSVISHSEYLPHAKIISSAAVDITDTDVLTKQGSRIAYDYLVVATGHTQSGAEAKSEKISQYQAEYEKIKAAESILIVGGGPTGVELAAEIAADFPAKKVTLVHRGSRLLEFIGESASKKALNWLTSKKVEVILEQSVDVKFPSDGVYRTSGGETVVADCYFLCTGTPFGSAWLKETILKDSLDSRGRVMVDSNLRIKGHNNIFAIGDITDVPELKQGYLAQEHAKVVAKNITSLIKGVEDDHKLAVYKPTTKALAIVSLGRKDAVAQFPCLSIAGRVPGIIKSGDLFVGKTRKGLGLQPGV